MEAIDRIRDIILTNNGYEVINLGIKQDMTAIINSQKEHHTDCICMSGLLVKSIAFMKDNLGTFNNVDIQVPVILGDAFTDLRFKDVTPVSGQSTRKKEQTVAVEPLAWAWRSYPMDSAETPPSLQKSEEKRSLRE